MTLQRARIFLILLLLLIPSAQFAWRNRDLPEFAYLHDDGLLFVSAKSLSSAGGFRLSSLPENPYQTKFPPLYPLYLSIVWRLNANFPANLAVVTTFCWISYAACLWLTISWMKNLSLPEWKVLVLGALMAVNPYLILFGVMPFSEIFFTCFVLGTFLCLRRQTIGMTVVAGLLAGAAYLTRTAGIALLVSVPLCFLWNRQVKRMIYFAAAMAPAVIGWTLWSGAHLLMNSASKGDPTLLYYTDYLGYRALNFGLDNLGVTLWKNFDQIMYGIGSLVLPKVFELGPVKILTEVIAVAILVGLFRLARRGVAIEYIAFGLVSTGIMLLWHFPPNERFVLPLLPLLLVGLAAEVENFRGMLKAAFRHKDASQRVAGGIMAAAGAGLLGGAIVLQGFVTFHYLDESAQHNRERLAGLHQAYTWISANVPAESNVLSYDDPLLYLYTGRRGNYLPLLSRWWYSEDHAAYLNAYRNVAAYSRGRKLDYVLVTDGDLSREVGDDDKQSILESLRANPELERLYQGPGVAVYKVARVAGSTLGSTTQTDRRPW